MIKNIRTFRRIAVCVFSILLLAGLNIHILVSQNIAIIGSGNLQNGITFTAPLISPGPTFTNFRSKMIFQQQELLSQGIVTGTVITAISFEKYSLATTVGGNNLEYWIFMGNSFAQPPLPTTLWTNILSSHSMVYYRPNLIIPSPPDWVTFVLDTPFVYLGNTLEIAFQYRFYGPYPIPTGPSVPVFQWTYSNGPPGTIIQSFSSNPSYQNLLFPSIGGERPNIRINFGRANESDAALTDFPELRNIICSNSTILDLNLTNQGGLTLDEATIAWKLNGVIQDTFLWIGNLPPGQTTNILLDTLNLQNGLGYSIEAFLISSLPAGPNLTNDTLKYSGVLKGFGIGLSGIYSLNQALPSGGTNFNSFADLAIALKDYKMCGPVTVNVEPGSGPYNEQFILDSTIGSSMTKPLVINGNGNTLRFAPVGPADDRAVFVLAGTDFVYVDSLKIVEEIDPTLTNVSVWFFGDAVRLRNGADNNTFINCEIRVLPSTTGYIGRSALSADTEGPGLNNAFYGRPASNLLIENCILEGGYFGTILRGGNDNNISQNNKIQNCLSRGLQLGIGLVNQKNFIIQNNYSEATLKILATTSIGAGGVVSGGLINSNFVIGGRTSLSVGGFCEMGSPVLISNNKVRNSIGYTGIGINANSGVPPSDKIRMINNSVLLMDDTIVTTNQNFLSAVQIYHRGPVEFKNNVIATYSEKKILTPIIIESIPGPPFTDLEIDNNVYFVNEPVNFNFNRHIVLLKNFPSPTGTLFQTLQAWQSSNGQYFDQSSVFADPVFDSLMVPTNPLLDNIGASTPSVPADYLGNLRSATPDPGAVEFDADTVCIVPTNLRRLAVGSNTIELDWDEAGQSSLWEIEYGISGFLLGTGTRIQVSQKPAVISGLSQITKYDVYVRAICTSGDTTNWSIKSSHLTSCNILSTPFFEGFDGPEWVQGNSQGIGRDIPDCWQTGPIQTHFVMPNLGPTPTINSGPLGDSNGQGTGKYFYLGIRTTTTFDNPRGGLSTPRISLAGLSDPILEFSYHMYGEDISRLVVEISSYSTMFYTRDTLEGEQQNSSAAPWKVYQVSLADFVGDTIGLYFLFEGKSGGPKCNIAIDALSIKEAPPCFPESELDVNFTVNDVSCAGLNNGSIIPVIQSNTGPYTFTWSDGSTSSTRTGLSEGEYQVVITDANGCTKSASFAIFEPFPLTFDPAVTDVDCHGFFSGSVSLLRETYADSATKSDTTNLIFSDLGFQDVTDRSGCPALVGIPTPQNAVITGIDVSYDMTSDSSSQVSDQVSWLYLQNAGSGEPSVTYGPNQTGPGMVSYTRNGLGFANGYISPGLLEFELHLGRLAGGDDCDSAFVTGANVEITVYYEVPSGTGNTTFLWSNGSVNNPLTSVRGGSYWVTARDGKGCQTTIQTSVYEPPLISVNSTVVSGTCPGDNTGQLIVAPTGGTGPISILWAGSGLTTDTLSNLVAGNYPITLTDSMGCTVQRVVSLFPYPVPIVSLGPDVTICEGTDLVLIAGTPNNTFNWSNGQQTPFAIIQDSGTYSVLVTNLFGCSMSDTIEVRLLPKPLVDIGSDSVFCNGDTLILTAGQGFSNYLWSTGAVTPSVSVTSAGWVSVTVTDQNGCEDQDSLLVTSLALPFVPLGPDTSFCKNSSLTLLAPTGFSSYQWNGVPAGPSQAITGPGQYVLAVQDSNGCTGRDTIQIAELPLPVVDLGPSNIGYCANSTLLLDAGPGFASYLWNDNSTSQQRLISGIGWVSIIVTDQNGCHGTDSIRVFRYPVPLLNIGPDTTLTLGDTLVLNAGNWAQYLWSTGDTTQIVSVNGFGRYWVEVVSAQGCITSDSIVISSPVPIEYNFESITIVVSPNPTQGFVTIFLDSPTLPHLDLTLVDARGRVLKNEHLKKRTSHFETTMDLSQLSEGMYYLRIATNGRVVDVIPIIKQ